MKQHHIILAEWKLTAPVEDSETEISSGKQTFRKDAL